MTTLDDFFAAHYAVEFLRRHNISDYWEETQAEDIVGKLSPRQVNYLVTIDRYGPCSLQTIMHYTGLSSSAASAAVDKMVRLGIAERNRNPANRREIQVCLTTAVQEQMRQIDARFRRRVAAILSDCTPEEQATINRSAAILRRKFTYPAHPAREA
ncbi:MAG: MarR family winged helix-turn-helix transcriptional regulator [Victivallales bacterium]|nr:MarR family winged helix-turn-helix transcriptional regulator [Victivallales bacterium]